MVYARIVKNAKVIKINACYRLPAQIILVYKKYAVVEVVKNIASVRKLVGKYNVVPGKTCFASVVV